MPYSNRPIDATGQKSVSSRLRLGLLATVVAGLALCTASTAMTDDSAVTEADAVVSTLETSADEKPATEKKVAEKPYKPKSLTQLRRELSPMQFNVTQKEGTEPAFQNKYWNNKRSGRYDCLVCEQPLFDSKSKFKSGTGWPSFFQPIESKAVGLKKDWKMFYARTEVHCSRCESHLGHVFNDGPRPTGKRFCMNSASMKFVDEKEIEAEKARTNESKSE